MSKKIVYLIGAGATQADLNYLGGERINLLMRNYPELGDGLCCTVLNKTSRFKNLGIKKSKSEEIDIEKLISLFENSGIKKYIELAEELRNHYYNEIVKILLKKEILKNPCLAICLLEMHRYIKVEIEQLSGIINLNHDCLFQVASQKLYDGINIGFEFISSSFKPDNDAPLLVKLHGSFNWIKGLPIKIIRLNQIRSDSSEILFIPPTIIKESKGYPFNKLTGIAYEILSKKCDILRIIGCSLSQNDWDIISLIFNSQYMQWLFNKECFRIELIMSPKSCARIKREYSYFQNIIPIQFLRDGDFEAYKQEEIYRSAELGNPFSYWLKTKAEYHLNRGEIDLNQKKTKLKGIIER